MTHLLPVWAHEAAKELPEQQTEAMFRYSDTVELYFKEY